MTDFHTATPPSPRVHRTSPAISALVQLSFGVAIVSGFVLLVILFAILNIQFIAFLLIFFCAPGLAAIYWLAHMYRRVQSRQVLMYLEQATRLGFPLPEYLETAARSESWILALRLRNLAQRLKSGALVGTAVANLVPEISYRQACLIAAGENAGRLRATLSRLVTQERQKNSHREEHAIYYRTYGVVVIGGMLGLMMFLMLFVVPKFREIFNDFKTSLPAITEWVLHITDLFVNSYLPYILLVLLGFGALMIIGGLIHRICLPGWPPVSELLPIRRLSWYVPIWHQLESDAGLADVCETMAEGAGSGMPIDRIFAQAECLQLNPVLHHRLQNWREMTLRGVAISAAARQAGLPEMVPGILATATGEDGMRRALEFLGHAYRARFSRTWLLIQGIGQPLIVLMLGLVVGTFVLAFFLPLVKLIASVSGYPGDL